jgi:hypothetical protein
MKGEAPFSYMPLIAAVVFSVLFVGVAIWRFEQEEF